MRQLKQFILEQVAAQRLAKDRAFDLLQEITAAETTPPTTSPAATAPPAACAVVGMSCRLPGASGIDELWDLLRSGRDAYGPFPAKRIWDLVRVKRALWEEYGPLAERATAEGLFQGYFLDEIDRFDAAAFDVLPAEAPLKDPADRLFTMVAWEALEDAGLTRAALKGSRTGVYLGHTPSTSFPYTRLLPDDPRIMPLNNPGMTGYHLSYWLDLRGPTMVINTTCSSSLVAVHLAMQALRRGEIDTAIVGGISLDVHPEGGQIQGIGVDSNDGRCRAYSARANGIRFGEGVVAFVLRRVDVAETNGDPIHAILRGSAINCDGHSSGLTVPSPVAQRDLLLEAWTDAGVDPADIGYVEGHGAGTKLGDPIEVQALDEAFARHGSGKGTHVLGSVKTNLGHLGDAAGAMGLLKTVLVVREGKLVPTLHFDEPNPLIPFARSAMVVNTELRDFATGGKPRVAGVSSFSISGTNCHVVVEQATARNVVDEPGVERVFVASARSTGALWRMCARVASWLEARPAVTLAELCHTAAHRRDHHDVRIAITARSLDDLGRKLSRILNVRDYEPVSVAALNADGIAWGVTSGRGPAATPATNAEAVGAYLTGASVDWERIFPRAQRKAISMPPVPFDLVRHWPSFEIEDEKAADQLFWDVAWVPREPDPRGRPVAGTWVLLVDDGPLARALVAGIDTRGGRTVVVKQGATFARHEDGSFTVPPTDEAAFGRVFDELAARRGPPVAGIVHAWTCRPAVDEEMTSLEALERSQDEGVMSLFHLSRVLVARFREPLELVCVTAFAHSVAKSRVLPNRSTGFGLVKVLSQEMPSIRTASIDVDLGVATPEEAAQHVLRELETLPAHRPDVVVYRDGRRFCQEMQELATGDLTEKTSPFRDGGTYVLAGGAGALGIAIAQDVSRRMRATFVILTRTAFPPRERWSEVIASLPATDPMRARLSGLAKVVAQGGTVEIVPVDVADPLAMNEAMDEIARRHPSIDGVVVAQKQLYHQLIRDILPESFRIGIMNRVRGTWLLDRLTRRLEPKFFVMLSSISSLIGTKTGAECCAVNVYLDGYADFRRAAGLPGQTLNLTNITDDTSKRLGPTPIPAITTASFLTAFRRFLHAERAFAVVTQFDFAEVERLGPILRLPLRRGDGLEVRPVTAPTPSSAALAQPKAASGLDLDALVGDVASGKGSIDDVLGAIDRELGRAPLADTAVAHAPPTAPIGAVDADVRLRLGEVWFDVLGAADVPGGTNFFEAGGSSLSALKLVKLVRARFGDVTFDVTDVYANPTFDRMARFLAEASGGRGA